MSNRSLSETRYPEVVFLGTGSATPEKTRNVSAILVNLRYRNHVQYKIDWEGISINTDNIGCYGKNTLCLSNSTSQISANS